MLHLSAAAASAPSVQVQYWGRFPAKMAQVLPSRREWLDEIGIGDEDANNNTQETTRRVVEADGVMDA
jgi:hypothetical protein